MGWTKDFKGFFWATETVPNVSGSTGVTQYSPWFSFSEFAMPFDDFTFVYNYEDVVVGVTSPAPVDQQVGVAIDIEWDVTGETIETDTVLSNDQEITQSIGPLVFSTKKRT